MSDNKEIWVFGDYRNYFQNRVTLQILARAVDLASTTGGKVCAVVFGNGADASDPSAYAAYQASLCGRHGLWPLAQRPASHRAGAPDAARRQTLIYPPGNGEKAFF